MERAALIAAIAWKEKTIQTEMRKKAIRRMNE
jgi:hypothetical protein